MIILVFLLLFTITAGAPSNPKVFEDIDRHQEEYVQRLKEWLAIESDSSDVQKREEVIRMMHLAAEKLKELNAVVELVELGRQKLHGYEIPLPPVILARIEKDPKKPTVCFYGHLDVQPAKFEDGWSTQPYNLTEIDGNLYGRGTSDDKGQVLAVLHAVEALQKHELPVNVKFVFEGMEEVGSNGLFTLVEQRNSTFFSDVDYIVVTDTAWLSNKPGLTYGTRGNCYFFVEVQGAIKDLHSGSFGGVVHEATGDLIFLLNTLVNSSGHILIPGIYDAVVPPSEKEKEFYKESEFNVEKIKKKFGLKNFTYSTKEEILMRRSCYPSLSIHGIEGAFSAPGTKTVIPAKVTGKFSIRLVPNMEPSVVINQVTDYLKEKFAERKSPNHIAVRCVIQAKPWLSAIDGPLYLAGKRAIKKGLPDLIAMVSNFGSLDFLALQLPEDFLTCCARKAFWELQSKRIWGTKSENHCLVVFNTEAEMFRIGGTIPIGSHFQEVTGKSAMYLGIGGPDDAPHGQNEKLSRFNFIEGTKLYAALLEEVASL